MDNTEQNRLVFKNENWLVEASKQINQKIDACLAEHGDCSLMLTGGNTARALYQYWQTAKLWDVNAVSYYFGDERCVALNHEESNYGLANREFFTPMQVQPNRIFRMKGEMDEHQKAANDYAQQLPARIDVMLFSMGPDGHIASLFPQAKSLNEKTKKVLAVTATKPPPERLTITPTVIQSAKQVFLFVTGKEKGEVLAEALKAPEDIQTMPVRLLLNATWLLDEDAADAFERKSLKETLIKSDEIS